MKYQKKKREFSLFVVVSIDNSTETNMSDDVRCDDHAFPLYLPFSSRKRASTYFALLVTKLRFALSYCLTRTGDRDRKRARIAETDYEDEFVQNLSYFTFDQCQYINEWSHLSDHALF